MKLNRTPILKALLAIVPVLLLAAVLPSVIALAVGSAKVTYTTDGNGTITSGSEETVKITETYWVDYTSDQRDAAKIGGAQAEPHTDYKLAYWTTDKNVYYLSADAYDNLVTISAGTQIEDLYERDYYVSEDTVFTAHFESTATTSYTVTYTVDENGEAFDEDKASESVEEGSSPTNVPEPVAKDATKYMFAYWTADVDVTLTDGTTITTGNKITTDQLKQVKVTSAITFTANFKRIVTVTYAIDGDGYFPAGSATTEDVPMGNCLTNIPTPLSSSDDVVFAYWSTNKKIEFTDGSSKGSGERITAAQLKRGMIDQTMTLTAHFTNRTYTMTYTTDANGYFDTTAATTEIVGLYGAPVNVPTPLAKDPDNYVFGYWVANRNVNFDDFLVEVALGNGSECLVCTNKPADNYIVEQVRCQKEDSQKQCEEECRIKEEHICSVGKNLARGHRNEDLVVAHLCSSYKADLDSASKANLRAIARVVACELGRIKQLFGRSGTC